jgi:hypothetical protein
VAAAGEEGLEDQDSGGLAIGPMCTDHAADLATRALDPPLPVRSTVAAGTDHDHVHILDLRARFAKAEEAAVGGDVVDTTGDDLAQGVVDGTAM